MAVSTGASGATATWAVNSVHLIRRRIKNYGPDTEKAEDQRREEEHARMKNEILGTESSWDMLEKAKVIPSQWLEEVEDGFEGNMYRMFAFTDPSKLPIGKILGCVSVFLIQLIGPIIILLSVTPMSVGTIRKDYRWDITDWWGRLREEWAQMGSLKLLSMLVIFVFVLNGRFVIRQEKRSWTGIMNIFRYLKRNVRNFTLDGIYYLYLGAVMNNYLVVTCSVDFLFIVGASQSPKDLLLDAICLIFVYNLDDVAGDLGFVTGEDWPGRQLSWIHSEMVASNYPKGLPAAHAHPGGEGGAAGCPARQDPSPQRQQEELMARLGYSPAKSWKGLLCLKLYDLSLGALAAMSVALPLCAALIPFHAVVTDGDV